MEKFIIFLVCIGLTILDNSFVPFFSIKGACPSLLFTFAIAYSLVNTKEKSVGIGIVSGVLQDIFFFNGFGVNCLINMILCLFSSKIGESMIKEKRTIPVVIMFLVTILKCMGVFVIFYFLNIKVDLFKSVIMGVYNSVVMFFIYKYVINVYDDEYTKQRWRFR